MGYSSVGRWRVARAALAGAGVVMLGFAPIASSQSRPAGAADRIELTLDASKTGAKIDRNIFGQFAEHLGLGVYEGVWVGPGFPDPQYARHPQRRRRRAQGHQGAERALARRLLRRRVSLAQGHRPAPRPSGDAQSQLGRRASSRTRSARTSSWTSSTQIGSEAYLSVNVGSGTPQEAADWLEYLTTAQPTALAKERAANGHAAPYKIAYLGIGNENWDCGGNMSPEYYLQSADGSTAASCATSIPRSRRATRRC